MVNTSRDLDEKEFHVETGRSVPVRDGILRAQPGTQPQLPLAVRIARRALHVPRAHEQEVLVTLERREVTPPLAVRAVQSVHVDPCSHR
jgi:hypothetical protein